MKGLDVKKSLEEKPYVIVSSKDALKDVTPMKWSEDVLSGERKIILDNLSVVK